MAKGPSFFVSVWGDAATIFARDTPLWRGREGGRGVPFKKNQLSPVI